MKRSLRTRAFPLSLLLGTLAVAAILVVGAVDRPADAQDAEFVIKFATVAPEGTPWTEQLVKIKNRIESESGGRIKFKLFPGSTLGGEVETIRKCLKGKEVNGWGGSTAAVAEGVNIPALQVFELPFMFESEAEVDFVMDSMFDSMSAKLEAKGLKMAFWHVNGWHNFATKSPIGSAQSLAGMKLRSQESPVHLAMFRALGAQPQTIPVPEVLSALQTGMVDGFSNTPLFTAATGWYEGGITDFTITHHIYQPAVILYSKELYDSMPADLQTILMGDRAGDTLEGRTNVRAITPALLEMFEENNINVTEMPADQRAALAEMCATVPDDLVAEGVIDAATVKAVRSAVATYRKRTN